MFEKMGQQDLQRMKRREREVIDKLRLLDDDLMTVVFDRNIQATEYLLQVILKRDDLKVTEVIAQREFKNFSADGHSIKLDIYAEDSQGKAYDIEIQKASGGAGVQRARFYSSMLDTRMLKAGEDYSQLRESYVIFITEHDILKAGLDIYHIERKIVETDSFFGDGSHILYVNGSYKDDSDPVGRLMHDFRCTDVHKMYDPLLAEQVRCVKEEQRGGNESMSDLVEEFVREFGTLYGIKYGEEIAEKLAQELAKERQKEIVQKLLNLGTMSHEQIAEITGFTPDEVRSLADAQSVQ